jgi:hypothetical protein
MLFSSTQNDMALNRQAFRQDQILILLLLVLYRIASKKLRCEVSEKIHLITQSLLQRSAIIIPQRMIAVRK